MQSERHLQSNRGCGSSKAEGDECGFRLHLREAKRRVDRKLGARVYACESQPSWGVTYLALVIPGITHLPDRPE